MSLKNILVVKASLHVATSEIVDVCVVPWGRYEPIWGIPYNYLVVDLFLYIEINEGVEVCFGQWGSYDTIGVIPSNVF